MTVTIDNKYVVVDEHYTDKYEAIRDIESMIKKSTLKWEQKLDNLNTTLWEAGSDNSIELCKIDDNESFI